MENKKRYIWKLYSGADWTFRGVAEVLPYCGAFVAIGFFLGWLVNVG